MRLRLKVRLKAIFVSCLLGILVYMGINVMFVSDESSDSSSNERRVASVRAEIETITLPSDWSPSEELSRKIRGRKEHAKEVCHKYGLDKRTPIYRPNSWEFLINEKYGLVWCSIFKAASSTWFYNFNILAGYTESHLLSTKETPIALARKRYPRPSVNELDRVINDTNKTLSFMIARHPFERLVSAFRDKIQSGNRFYRNLARKIMAAYPSMGPKSQTSLIEEAVKVSEKILPKSKTFLKYVPPSFQQFVQFIIESFENVVPLDEHWTPMTNFCTPCLVNFDVYAKVESLDEDGNYIIFKSGIDKLIHPKRINRSKNEPTHEVARSYLCQLSADQKDRLLKVYKYDLEIFDYQSDHLLNCTNYS